MPDKTDHQWKPDLSGRPETIQRRYAVAVDAAQRWIDSRPKPKPRPDPRQRKPDPEPVSVPWHGEFPQQQTNGNGPQED